MNPDLEKIIKTYQDDFISSLHQKYGIPKEELEEISHNCFPTKKSPPKNAWQAFSNAHRPILKKKGLTFGQIAKELGRIWSTMSSQEKARYQSKSIRSAMLVHHQEETLDSSSMPTHFDEVADELNKEPIPTDFTTEREKELWVAYRDFKMSQLRSMSVRLGLETSVNRRHMILGLVLHRLSAEKN